MLLGLLLGLGFKAVVELFRKEAKGYFWVWDAGTLVV